MIKRTVYMVSASEWNDLVIAHYQRWLTGQKNIFGDVRYDYDICDDEGWGDETGEHLFEFEKRPMGEDEKAVLVDFLNERSTDCRRMTTLIMLDFCDKGLLEPGAYLILT